MTHITTLHAPGTRVRLRRSINRSGKHNREGDAGVIDMVDYEECMHPYRFRRDDDGLWIWVAGCEIERTEL